VTLRIFQRVTIQDIPVMFISEYGVPAVSAPRAFDRLERALSSRRGRKFYGTFDPSTSEYRACVAPQEGDQPEAVAGAADSSRRAVELYHRSDEPTCSSLF
jgi:hypothetical protein